MATKWKNMIRTVKKYPALAILFSLTIFIASFATIIKFGLSTEYFGESFQSSAMLRQKVEYANDITTGFINTYRSQSKNPLNIDEEDLYYFAHQFAQQSLWDAGFYFEENSDGTLSALYDSGGTLVPADTALDILNRFSDATNYRPGEYPRTAAESELTGDYSAAATAIEETAAESYSIDFREYVQYYYPKVYVMLRDEREAAMASYLDELSYYPDICYYIFIDGSEYHNGWSPDSIRGLNAYSISSNRTSETNVSGPMSHLMDSSESTVVAMGLSDTYYYNLREHWSAFKTLSYICFSGLVVSVIVFFLALAYVIIQMGKPAEYPVEEYPNGPPPGALPLEIPKGFFYTDLAAGLIIAAFSIPLAMISATGAYYYRWNLDLDPISRYINAGYVLICLLISFIAALIITGLLYSLIWDFKNKRLVKHSLCYALLDKLMSSIHTVSDLVNMGYRLVSARKLRKIKEGIKRIQAGDFTTPINIKGRGHMAQIAAGLNDISAGFNVAVENRIKSERLKTELISNVSHDIRTPLTSIVTYVDLLKKEGNTEEDTFKYLEVLESKTARLKILIDDLFEASKASSGNVAAELAPTDVYNVIEQAMGELEDKIEASGLDFRISAPEQRIFAIADGKLLWRVINNLFSNIFKYSMPNSRVYIDANQYGDKVHLVFKNMSAYELNITAEELVERFTRGDQSRNSEGSGLGLNIARSLVQIMNGEFSLELDGDLFKVIIILDSQN